MSLAALPTNSAMVPAVQRLLVVGDSVVLGATEVVGSQIVSKAAVGFVDRLRTLLPDWAVNFDGGVHRTTVGALAALPALLAAQRPDIVFFMVGGSDADIDWRRFILKNGASVRSNVPIEKFSTNLNRICDLCGAAGAVPVLMDMPSCDLQARTRWLEAQSGKSLANMIAGAGGQAECDRRTLLYVKAVETISAARQLPVAQWAREAQSLPVERRFGADGFHPGEDAHVIIAAAVARAVRQAADRGAHPKGPNVAACA